MTTNLDGSLPSAPVTDAYDGAQEFNQHSSRQRGLFPLPCAGNPLQPCSGLSRRCKQRAGRRYQLQQRVSEMTCALTSLYGVEGFRPAQNVSPAQREAQQVLRRAAEAFKPPVSRASPQEALRALLRSSAVYGDGSSTAPESIVQATPVQDLVRSEDSEYLVGFKEKVLLSSEELRETVASQGHVRVHVDPALKRASVYKRFIWRLVSLGMVRLSLDAECECGVFCVWKKNGKQRVIVDARCINQRCKKPPSVRLCSGDGLGRLELPQELHLHVAQADVDNCFHRMRMPTEMQRWFSLPRISAANLGGVRIGREYPNDSTPVFPLLETLPMGFSWSLFFAQSAHEAIVERCAGLNPASRITDFIPGRRLKTGDTCHLQYVDNFAVLGGDPESLTKTKERVRESMGNRGLFMREHEDADKGMVELLGHVIKAVEGTVSISPGRAWRLRDAMLYASRLRSLSGMALELILGHAGFCFLVRRCMLSILGRSYAFVQAHYSAPAPLWLSVRRELRNAAYLLPLAFSNLRRPWSSTVWCVDAATHGFAAMRSSWAPRSVAEVGRLEERWRLKLTSGMGPGPRELALADVQDEVVGGEWKNVPKKLLSPCRWSRVYCGRVQNVDVPIHMKEADAALFVAKHLVRCSNNGQGRRHLIFGDSMTLSYVLGKGRASDPRLLAIARKWACISMAGDLLLGYRWTPSEYNVADKDSRRWEDNNLLCETTDLSCSSDLKPMVAEAEASVNPLLEDASPWTEYCAQQISQTYKPIRRGGKPRRAPIRRLVRWEPFGENKGVSASSITSGEGCDFTSNSSCMQNYPDESCGEKSPGPQLLRKQYDRAGNYGKLPESYRGPRDVCVGDLASIGLEKWDESRGDMLGVSGSLVHPRVRAGDRDTALGRHTNAVPPLQPSWRFGYAKDSQGLEGVDKTDALDEPVAFTVDNGCCSASDSMASQKACDRSSNRTQLCGLSPTRRTGDSASTKFGGTDQAREYWSNRTILIGDSGGRTRYPEQNSHLRRFCDPRPTRPHMDGPALASSEDRKAWTCLADSCESKRPGSRYQEHLRGARLQKTRNCCSQPTTWGPVMGLHEKIPQPRRDSAEGTLAQLVKRFTLPKSFKTPRSDAARRSTTSRVWEILRRQPRAPPRRPHGRTIFPWIGYQCFIEIGNVAASVSRAVKRCGVTSETWSSWYGTQHDISIEKKTRICY